MYTCSYIDRIAKLRHHKFTYAEAGVTGANKDGGDQPFEALITKNKLFDFDQEDITHFRQQFRAWLCGLSNQYLEKQKKLLDRVPAEIAGQDSLLADDNYDDISHPTSDDSIPPSGSDKKRSADSEEKRQLWVTREYYKQRKSEYRVSVSSFEQEIQVLQDSLKKERYLPWTLLAKRPQPEEGKVLCPACQSVTFDGKFSYQRHPQVDDHYKKFHLQKINSLVYNIPHSATRKETQFWSALDLALAVLQAAKERYPFQPQSGASLSKVCCILNHRIGWATKAAVEFRLSSSGKGHGLRKARLSPDEAYFMRSQLICIDGGGTKRVYQDADIDCPKKATANVRLIASHLLGRFDYGFRDLLGAWERADYMESAPSPQFHLVAEALDLAFCHVQYFTAFSSLGFTKQFCEDPIGFIDNVIGELEEPNKEEAPS